MFKNLLYTLAVILLLLTCYFGYDWYISDPTNKEPLPALLSFGSSLIALIIAWMQDSNASDKDNVTFDNIREDPLVDLDPKDNTNYKFKNIRGKNTRILVGKGKESLKFTPPDQPDNPNLS